MTNQPFPAVEGHGRTPLRLVRAFEAAPIPEEHVARTGLRLDAAAYHGVTAKGTESVVASGLMALVEDLAPSEQLAISVAPGADGSGPINWRIEVEAGAATQLDAGRRARELAQDVVATFRFASGLHLREWSPREPPELRGAHKIFPVGVSVSEFGPKVVAARTSNGSVGRLERQILLPLVDPAHAAAVRPITALARLPQGHEVRWRFGAITLDRDWPAAVDRVMELLEWGTQKGIRLGSGVRLGSSSLRRFRSVWHLLLGRLQAKGRIVCVEVSVVAPKASSGVVPRLGGLAFPGYEVTEAPPRSLRVDTLDLRGAVIDTSFVSRLIPSAEELRALAFRPVFRPPREAPRISGCRLGTAGGRTVAIGDRERSRHVYVLGGTGTGKSTLLANLIVQDLEAGEGLCLIDPHGDLYEEVLHRIPKKRVPDVVLFNPCDFDRAPGLNYLETAGPHRDVQASLVTNELIEIFDHLYDLERTGGPMFELYMRNALLLLMQNDVPGLTLCEVPLVFEDGVVRAGLLRRCRSPEVVSFWKAQAEKADGEASLRNIAPYVTSKLNQFSHNALVRAIVGQSRSSIDFEALLNRRQVLLVNLAKGLLNSKDAQLLGMLLIGRIFRAAMGRVKLPPQQRHPHTLYVDEFHSFLSAGVAGLLGESRKFGLRLVLANQHLAQLSDRRQGRAVRSAVLGNAANLLLFRLGAEDAANLAGVAAPELDEHELQFLPDFHALARIQSGNRPLRPFVLCTDAPRPPRDPREAASSRLRIEQGQARYCQPRDEVLDATRKRREAILRSLAPADEEAAQAQIDADR
jgi:hypothetical protein